MTDFLDKLISDAEQRIQHDYYNVTTKINHQQISLSQALKNKIRNAIVAEIKPKSPSRGILRATLDPIDTAIRLARGGAIGLSVLTEPDNFAGTLERLPQIRSWVNIPLLMKDVIVDEKQITAGRESGADCILLMLSALSKRNIESADLIEKAHDSLLEVLLEVHDLDELTLATETEADIIGINNRNMTSLEIDLDTTPKLLGSIAAKQLRGKQVISESGIETVDDVQRLKRSQVDGFLVGSSIMLARDPESKVRELVHA